MNQPIRILYCNCSYADVIPAEVKGEVLERLNASGIEFEAVADLCELSARRSPTLKRIAQAGDLRIAACYPRAVRWLFHAAGAPLNTDRVQVFNMRTQSPDQVAAGLLPEASGRCTCRRTAPAGRIGPQLIEPEPGAWVPWFPVIDYDRCANCKQCLSFCLFGVYGLNADDRVEVRNPDQCKTGCPACSRVCPQVAIMFPKYDKSPVNGDVVRDEDVKGEPVKVDVLALVGDDIHAALRARRSKTNERFPAGQEPAEVLAERRRFLQKMQAELDIPEGVLQALGPEGGRTRGCDCDGPGENDSASERDCDCSDESRVAAAGEQPGEPRACCEGTARRRCDSAADAADI